eukprot:11212383-Lingulodinium_polyedra.AAC.1
MLPHARPETSRRPATRRHSWPSRPARCGHGCCGTTAAAWRPAALQADRRRPHAVSAAASWSA